MSIARGALVDRIARFLETNYPCNCFDESCSEEPEADAIVKLMETAGFGPVKEAGAKALEEAADAWREYLPAVAGYGNVQPVPVWLERRAEWHRRA